MNKSFLLAALLCALNTFAADVSGREVTVYLTAKDTNQRLAKAGVLKFEPKTQPGEREKTVFVYPSKKFQTFLGIGAALTDASAETFYKLPKEKQQEFLKAYFDPKEGIGYTLARTHIHSCDFSSESYTYVTDGDKELKSFDISHDEKFRIPFIKEARAAAGGNLPIFVSPWSPPAWMKTSTNMLQGGKLKLEFADSWANYFVKFIKAYERKGIPIWGLTVQNEPMARQTWESCIYTADEERDFITNNLGPTLAKAGLQDKKLIIWDHNRDLIFHRASTILDDPQAAKYVWGVGYHWYSGDQFNNLKLVQDAYPKINLLVTEACNYPWDFAKINDWHWGESYGWSMINDFNNGAVGWTDWNILLDETGGPNHVNNFCYAPVHGDTHTGQLHYMNSYYYIGHFSKFIRPGAKRVASSSMTDSLVSTAFQNKDGSIVVVVMNNTDKEQPFFLWCDGQAAKTTSPAHSIQTLVF
ncbi:MAG: glycoside hydrolase family 30 protein [Verrucomicrobiales bacterium]|nr:glycoside hydrolase family 30 protein [Verrucomicrobiales bacterium]